MRTPPAVAAVLLAGSLVLSGCSLLSSGDGGGDGGDPGPKASADAPRKATSLPSTAWVKAAGSSVATGGTLRLAADAVPRSFNPLHADAAMSDAATILSPTSGTAIRITADGGWTVDPDHAESVEVTDKDPLTVKVRLNPKAVWQGGTPITAKDMVAFWKAQRGSDDAYEVSSTAGYEDIGDVRPGDDTFSYSVVFKKPTGDWPQYIYPRLPANISSSAKLFNSGFRSRAIPSNGPYLVDSIDTRSGLVVQKPNPRWWGAKPKLRQITWQVGTPEAQATSYAAGDLDVLELDESTYDAARGTSTGTVQRAAGVEWTQVTLNGARGPLRSVAVRQAVAHAIDRQAIATRYAKAVGAPAQTLGSLVYVPGQIGYHDSSAAIAHDPAESARLLADDGWVKGTDGVLARKGKKLMLTMPVPAGTPTNSQRAAQIVADLAKVGIQVKLRTVPAAKFFDGYVVPLDFDLVTFAWQGSAFPVAAAEPLFYPLDSVQNFTGLEDDDLGAAWDKGSAALDQSERTRVVKVLDARLLRDVPMVPLAVKPIVMGVRRGLVNYGAAQFEQPDWTTVGFRAKTKK